MVKISFQLLWNGYHNIPKKYIRRVMFKGVVYENNHGMTPTVVYDYTKNWVYGESAPWTSENQNENDPRSMRKEAKPLVPPLKEWIWFRGDLVKVLVGKDAGKIGEIVGVIKQRNWVIVGGLNFKLQPSVVSGSGSVMRQVERPLSVPLEVKLIDPYNNEPCDATWRYLENGERIRVSKQSGREIPLAESAFSTIDYFKKSAYKPAAIDTDVDEVKKRTFEPKLKTFEQDLMDEYGIKEERKRAKTYFY